MEAIDTQPTVEHVDSLEKVCVDITACRTCPRLVQWREDVAAEKRASFRDEEYWGKGVPGFGDPDATVWVMGLAPAAHGANRTGRMFTGDRSGDWLYRAMHRAGLATQERSVGREDGLRLTGSWVSSAVRCAPPDNKPSNEERDQCAPWFLRELELALPTTRAFVALGNFAWVALFSALAELGHPVKKAKFGHGAEVKYEHNGVNYLILASFHPSQQNTFTGKLTKPMLDSVLKKAGRFAHVLR